MTTAHFQSQALSCACGNGWFEQVPAHVSLKVFVAVLKAARCPRCDNGWRMFSLGHVPRARGIHPHTGAALPLVVDSPAEVAPAAVA